MMLLCLALCAWAGLLAQPGRLRLTGLDGARVRLPAACTPTVIVLLGPECPLSQQYMPLLRRLHEKYHPKGIEFYGVFEAGSQAAPALGRFATDYPAPFRLLADRQGRCIGRLAGRVTPEVFVLDSAGVVRYRGAIDNQYYALGRRRGTVTENYLADALDALLNRSEIKTKETDAVGCLLNPPRAWRRRR